MSSSAVTSDVCDVYELTDFVFEIYSVNKSTLFTYDASLMVQSHETSLPIVDVGHPQLVLQGSETKTCLDLNTSDSPLISPPPKLNAHLILGPTPLACAPVPSA